MSLVQAAWCFAAWGFFCVQLRCQEQTRNSALKMLRANAYKRMTEVSALVALRICFGCLVFGEVLLGSFSQVTR